jgi:pilus assembly protein CpaB
VNKRLVVKVLLAGALALVGTTAMVAYVRTAKNQAVAGEERKTIFVMDQTVAKGADATAIRNAIKRKDVPVSVVAEGAITDDADITDTLVAAVELRSGEQLLVSRLAPKTSVVVPPPDGLVTITIALEPERALGGQLQNGDLVGVFLSFDPFEVDAAGQAAAPGDPSASSSSTSVAAPTKTPNMTHLELHKVLVTSVQYDKDSAAPVSDLKTAGSAPAQPSVAAPSGKLLVTLALAAPQAEQLVFAAEFGHVWLANEPKTAVETGTGVVTLDGAYRSLEGA